MSHWLYDGLEAAGYDVALSAMAIKTDRRDARGIAQLLRMGWFRPVHRKSASTQRFCHGHHSTAQACTYEGW